MHSGNMSEMEQASLTEQEKEALLQVMERAKEFDRQSSWSHAGQVCIEGNLYKWTNPLKGWQTRWFSVDHQQGVINYHTSEDKKKHPPRGSLQLWGAVIAPSEEDSQTFTINGANGEIYKLRGQDAKERQFWVSRLRREVEFCTNQSFTSNEVVDAVSTAEGSTTSPRHTSAKIFSRRMSSSFLNRNRQGNKVVVMSSSKSSSTGKSTEIGVSGVLDCFPGGDPMLEALIRLQTLQENFYIQLQTCSKQTGLSPTDKEVLLTRATSEAAVTSVKNCLALMKLQRNPGPSPTQSPKPNEGSDKGMKQLVRIEMREAGQDDMDTKI